MGLFETIAVLRSSLPRAVCEGRFTDAFAEVFDAKRGLFFTGNPDLEIMRWSSTSGYETVETLSTGWFGARVTEHATGAEFFEFRIAETSGDLVSLFGKPISHLKVGEYGYKFQGVEEPKQNTIRVWLIRCAPIGERLTAIQSRKLVCSDNLNNWADVLET